MKYLVISDSHGNKKLIQKVLSENLDVAGVFFLGDIISDITSFKIDNLFSVKGNCDFLCEELDEILVDVEGKRILATHGNKYQVKNNYLLLEQRSNELHADIVLFGHTHFATIYKKGSVLFVNPGNLSKFNSINSYAIINTNECSAEIKEIE